MPSTEAEQTQQQSQSPAETPLTARLPPLQPAAPTAWDVLRGVRLRDLAPESWGRIPCAKGAALNGVGVGVAVFVARGVLLLRGRGRGSHPPAGATTASKAGPWMRAGNWGMAAGLGTAAVSWEYCRYKLAVVRRQLDAMAAAAAAAGGGSSDLHQPLARQQQ